MRVLAGTVVALVITLGAAGQPPAPAAAQSFFQSAKCGVFYDKWNVAGAPTGTLATVGMSHERLAARDCLSRNDTRTACEHYRRALAGLNGAGPALASEHEPEIKAQMQEVGCR